MTTTDTTVAALVAHGEALRAVAGSLRGAFAVQWAEPPRRMLDTGPGRSGRVSDPVPRVALNDRRLKVRAAVIEAESALAVAADRLNAATVALDEAVAGWWSE